MIDTRTHQEDIEAAPALRRLGGSVAHLLASAPPDAAAVTKTLIDAGDLSAAVLDELLPHADDLHPAAALWTAPVTSLARASDAAWRGDGSGCDAALRTAISAIDACARSYVPREVTCRRSPGPAYAPLGPQVFAEAAREWFLTRQSRRIVCLGLRPAGLTLAAAAAAGLASRRADVTVMTLRARGTPAARSVALTPRFGRAIQEWNDVTFLVVDDGPTVSGTSLACVAQALSGLGVDDHRIVLMPSQPPAANVLPEYGVLDRHAILVSDFEPAWVTAGRPGASVGKLVAEGGIAG